MNKYNKFTENKLKVINLVRYKLKIIIQMKYKL